MGPRVRSNPEGSVGIACQECRIQLANAQHQNQSLKADELTVLVSAGLEVRLTEGLVNDLPSSFGIEGLVGFICDS